MFIPYEMERWLTMIQQHAMYIGTQNTNMDTKKDMLRKQYDEVVDLKRMISPVQALYL